MVCFFLFVPFALFAVHEVFSLTANKKGVSLGEKKGRREVTSRRPSPREGESLFRKVVDQTLEKVTVLDDQPGEDDRDHGHELDQNVERGA